MRILSSLLITASLSLLLTLTMAELVVQPAIAKIAPSDHYARMPAIYDAAI